MTWRRTLVALTVLTVVGVAGLAYASTPEPSTPQEWCRVVDLASGDEVTVPCHRDPVPTTALPTTVPVTTAPPTTDPTPTTQPSPSGFTETFTGNTGFERFTHGIYHRDGVEAGKPTTVQGDHAHGTAGADCGDPATQRTVHRDVVDESFYVCRDHLMTAIGDWTGYSIGWFSPPGTFTAGDVTTVSWDVNVTDLGSRQWWEMTIVPAAYSSGVAECPHCSAAGGGVADVAGVPLYPPGAVVVGLGPFGDPQFPGVPWWFSEFCAWVDGPGCASKAIRRTVSITDNRDGTVTTRWQADDETHEFTAPGAFPTEFRVVFKDHNYTPDKDGPVAGHTWHWDTIVID